MFTVKVPAWAASNTQFEFPIEFGKKMGRVQGARDVFTASGPEIVWSAIIAGRPLHLLQAPGHADNQRFAQWRVTTTLEMLEVVVSSSGIERLKRPDIFHKEVDSTEKGFLNSILGQTMTHLYLTKERKARWLAHYRLYAMSLATGAIARTTPPGAQAAPEPDYLGLDKQLNFIVAEAKGYGSLSNKLRKELDNKRQAGAVLSINNRQPLNLYGVAMLTGEPGGKGRGNTHSVVHGENQISLYVTDPDGTIEVPTASEWVKAFYTNVEKLCKTDAGQKPNDLVKDDWVQISFDVPVDVMRWAEDLDSAGVAFESWRRLQSEMFEEYGSKIIAPELIVANTEADRRIFVERPE